MPDYYMCFTGELKPYRFHAKPKPRDPSAKEDKPVYTPEEVCHMALSIKVNSTVSKKYGSVGAIYYVTGYDCERHVYRVQHR